MILLQLISCVLGHEDLSEDEIDEIRAFKLRMLGKMPREFFDQMRYAFAHKMTISSLYVVTNKLALLSRVHPVWIDCCVNSCIAYTKEYQNANNCPECNQVRYRANGRPRRVFCYIPFIPRLQRFFQNRRIRQELLYRHEYQHEPGIIADVFDCEHYRNLCKTLVTVRGEQLPHCYFSGKHDIAFSTCLDSYLLYKRRRSGPSALPIVLQIYNFPSDVRTHLAKLMCLGVIPGPKGPKQLHTFLDPFEDECEQLARGVITYDCVDKEWFPLHGYHLFPLGDIIALEKLLNLKGHNGKSPCRSCEIKVVNNPESVDNKTYYVPLVFPGQERRWNPRELPLRSHAQWAQVVAELDAASTRKFKNQLAMYYGIKGMPAITWVGSVDFARGVPWDFMHLLFENVVKNLIHLWMGRFKGLDCGDEDYEIPLHIWSQIGVETVDAVKDIPAAFVRSLGNIADDQASYTAESWAFWFLFLGPSLLKGRLGRKFHNHYLELVDIMKICLKFTITLSEVDDLETNIIEWVEKYEK